MQNTDFKKIKQNLKYNSKGISLFMVLFTDFLSMIFALGPGLIAWLTVAFFLKTTFSTAYFIPSLVGIPLVLVITFLVAVRIFRLFIPKMKPGIYKMGLSKGFAAWYLTLCLGHGVRIFGLTPFFFTFYITKFLYWRAMGAKVSLNINSSLFLTLVDYPLITIEGGCSFGAYTHVACHTFLGDKLYLAPVNIGKNVYIGMNTTIGPKSKIGDNCWIGLNNKIMQDTIPASSMIDNLEWEYGNPKKQKNRLKNSPRATGESTCCAQ